MTHNKDKGTSVGFTKSEYSNPENYMHCQCDACKEGVLHSSDCAVHNEPAEPNDKCDCGAIKNLLNIKYLISLTLSDVGKPIIHILLF